MSLARRIRDCRYSKGWGPDELASRAQISRTALYQIECGKTETPRAGTLNRIARALGVSVDALMGGGETLAWDGAATREATGSESVRELFEGEPGDLMPRLAALPSSRMADIERKFHELLQSPLRDGLVRLVEASYRLLPSEAERSAI